MKTPVEHKTESLSTEERLKAAARQIFMAKGFDGTTSRDIAEAAGINVALTNYYFRSKKKLFYEIFGESLQEFFLTLYQIIQEPIDIKTKVRRLIETDYEKLRQNPQLPAFIFHEIRTNADDFLSNIPIKNLMRDSFYAQIDEAVARGEMRPIEPVNCIGLIIGSIQFMFLGKPMIMAMNNFDEETFWAFSERQRDYVIEMVLGYLFPEK